MMLPLDHIGILGSDITAMANAYRSLGFHVTEPERLNAGAGGDFGRQYSAHVIFENTYIELTAVENCQSEHHLAPYMRLPGGVRILILQSDCAEKEREGIQSTGLSASPLFTAERPLTYGDRTMARFCWFALEPRPLNQLLIGWVEHLTREAVFRSDGPHGNTATDITGLHLSASDFPASLAKSHGVHCSMSEQSSEAQVVNGVELLVEDLSACVDQTAGVLDSEARSVSLADAGGLGVNLIFRQAECHASG